MNYFVTGTDTGVGKTLVSCALLHAFAAQGLRVIGMKPVASGCGDDGRNEDVMQLRAAGNIPAGCGQVNPYNFIPAIAPHIAARYAGVRIDLARILTSYHELASQADMVIVEGAGGFRTPLNEKQDGADLAVQLGLPVILVVGMRLGCLNHALLTAAAIKASGLELAGWVANVPDADDTTRRCEASGAGVPSGRLLPQTAGYASNVSKAGMPVLRDNIAALERRLEAPLLGVVKYQPQPDARVAAPQLNIELLNNNGPDNA